MFPLLLCVLAVVNFACDNALAGSVCLGAAGLRTAFGECELSTWNLSDRIRSAALRCRAFFNDSEGSTMAVQMCDVEVWVMLNDSGEYVAHEDADQLNEEYAERIGDIADASGIRRVKLTVRVPLPAAIELVGKVATVEEPGELSAA